MKMANLEELLLKHMVHRQNDHFVLREFQHASDYVNKALASPNSTLLSEICYRMIDPYRTDKRVNAVVTPAVAGIPFMTMGTHLLNMFQERRDDETILGLYADKVGNDFMLDRGYADLIKGRGFIALEDVVTSGESLKKVIAAAVKAGGILLGATSMWDRRANTAEMLGVPAYYPAISRVLPEYSEADCPMCKEGKPVNLELGRGRAFVAWKEAQKEVEDLIHWTYEGQHSTVGDSERSKAREAMERAKKLKYDNHPRIKKLGELYPLAA